jgi:signal peptidase I
MEKPSNHRSRKPAVAAILSLAAAGLGHVYAGRPWQAALMVIASAIAANLSLATFLYSDLGWTSILLAVLLPIVAALSIAVHSAFIASRVPADQPLKAYQRWYVYVLFFVVAAILTFKMIGMWGEFKTYRVPTSSMEDAIMPGDFFLAKMSAYDRHEPSRGDVVILIYPVDGKTVYVERCVGLPGDSILIEDKTLFVNGVPAIEPSTIKFIDATVLKRGDNERDTRDNFGPYVVPPDSYFVLGDNRDNSYDSRYWRCAKRRHIIGKAQVIYWSADMRRIGKRVR